MTPAATPEALEQALALEIADILLDGGALSPKDFARRIAAGPALQRVTAERDEARRRLAGKGMPAGPSLWGRFPGTGVWHQIDDGRHTEEEVVAFERTYANAGWTDLTRVNPFDRRSALATATAEAASLRAKVEALKGALIIVKTWIDTDLPAGTSRAGSIHRVVTKALDRTALARAATAGEG